MLSLSWIILVTLTLTVINGQYYDDYEQESEYEDKANNGVSGNIYCENMQEWKTGEYYKICISVTDNNIGQSLSNHDTFIVYSSGHIETLTPHFASANYLQKLSFEGVSINKIEMSAFLGLNQLKYLNLKGTGISRIPPAIFVGLVALEELILSNNMIGDTLDSRNFSNLPVLKRLSLSNNQIYYLKPLTFKMQKNLTHLYLDNNYISKLESQLFKFSNSFEEIWLFNNNLMEIENITLLFMPESRYPFSLNVRHNNITVLNRNLSHITVLDAGFNNIVKLNHFQGNKLEKLLLNNNKINGTLTPGIFSEVPELNELRIDCNAISDLEYGSFTGLDKLIVLNISFNELSTINSKIFQPLKNLSLLLIGGNQLKSLNIPMTKSNLPMLRQIGLNHNLWYCDSLSDLVDILEEKGIELVHHAPKMLKSSNVNGITCRVKESAVDNNNKSLNETISDLVKDHIQKIVHNHISLQNSNITEIINNHVKENLLPLVSKTVTHPETTIGTTMQTYSSVSTEPEDHEDVTTETKFKTTAVIPEAMQTTAITSFAYNLENKINNINQKIEQSVVRTDKLQNIDNINEKIEQIDVIIDKLQKIDNINEKIGIMEGIIKTLGQYVMNQANNSQINKNQFENGSIPSFLKSVNTKDNNGSIEIKSSLIIIIILLSVVLVILFYNFYKKYYLKHVKRYQSDQIMEVNELQI